MSQVLIVGDWHGNVRWANRVLERAYLAGINEIYHLGDFGIWPGEKGQNYLAELNQTCDLYGIVIYFIDGNHEDFPQIYSHEIDPESGLRQITDYIWHIPRGHRFEVDGKTWMGLGGATSLDRRGRREGIDWWPEEALTLGEAYKAAQGGPVDVMLTHDCPAGVDIPGLGAYSWPAEALSAANRHRETLAHVVHDVAPEILFHGHFHRRYDSIRHWKDGTTRPTKIVGLDGDCGLFRDNAIILDTETLAYSALV